MGVPDFQSLMRPVLVALSDGQTKPRKRVREQVAATLGLTDEIAGAVDINPHRQGYFMPGTGHQIFGPDDLVEMKPDAVIVMNPIYKDEIAADLEKRGLHPEIFAVDDGLETLKKS